MNPAAEARAVRGAMAEANIAMHDELAASHAEAVAMAKALKAALRYISKLERDNDRLKRLITAMSETVTGRNR